jgi:hypothetical protein
MEWIPIVLVTFKVLVLGIGMFFAVKWHYDQGNKAQDEKRAVLRAAGKVVLVFAGLLLGLGVLVFVVSRQLGLDLGWL